MGEIKQQKNGKNRSAVSIKKRKVALIEALTKTLGIISTACEMCGEHRRQYYKWMDTDKKFRKAVEEISEREIDFAESALLKNIRAGKEKSIIFYLSNKARTRGYGDKVAIEGSVEHKHEVPISGFSIEVIERKTIEATAEYTEE